MARLDRATNGRGPRDRRPLVGLLAPRSRRGVTWLGDDVDPAMTHRPLLRRVRRRHLPRDLDAHVPLDERDLVLALEVEPELRPATEVAAEADGGIGVDGTTAAQDAPDPARRHAECEG
jgi:hypothetical protein